MAIEKYAAFPVVSLLSNVCRNQEQRCREKLTFLLHADFLVTLVHVAELCLVYWTERPALSDLEVVLPADINHLHDNMITMQ